MSETLRTRIAKALYGRLVSPMPPFDSQSDAVKAAWLADADAVIRELGLQQEDGECGYCHAQLPGCRYVTDWKANDD